MKVFLTQATGYIGSAVSDRLRAASHEITGLARSDEAAARLTSAGIRPVRGDFSNPASVGAAARAADGVISLATTYNPGINGPAIDAILEVSLDVDRSDSIPQADTSDFSWERTRSDWNRVRAAPATSPTAASNAA